MLSYVLDIITTHLLLYKNLVYHFSSPPTAPHFGTNFINFDMEPIFQQHSEISMDRRVKEDLDTDLECTTTGELDSIVYHTIIF